MAAFVTRLDSPGGGTVVLVSLDNGDPSGWLPVPGHLVGIDLRVTGSGSAAVDFTSSLTIGASQPIIRKTWSEGVVSAGSSVSSGVQGANGILIYSVTGTPEVTAILRY
jgi:hypothetical protein